MNNQLNKLLKLNIDAHRGYHFAAEEINNQNFKNFLAAYARQREKYAKQLSDEIESSGTSPSSNGTFLGELHRGLMKIREKVSSTHDAALLEECMRGESEAIHEYKKVLKADQLSHDQKQMVMTQLDKIRAAEGTMREISKVL